MENDFIHFDRDALKITIRFKTKPPLVIDLDHLDISYFSGGPGGQNVNKNMSGVRLIYHVPEGYRMGGLKAHELIAKSIGERQRDQNLMQAFRTLAGKLRNYFYVKPFRRPTKTPYRAKQKRLTGKKILSLKKQARQPSDY